MSKRTKKKKRSPARKRRSTKRKKKTTRKRRAPSFTTKGIPWPEPKRLIVVVR